MLKKIIFFGVMSFSFMLVGCLSESEEAGVASQKVSEPDHEEKEKKNRKISNIKEVSIDGDTFIIKGEDLNKVRELSIKDESGITEISILKKTKDQIWAKPTKPLSLIASTLYSLFVTSAHGKDVTEETVPITITITLPNLSVNATCQSNGHGGGSKLRFEGYTTLTNAAIGGYKGGNELCHSAFPGSHWASVDELMTLGDDYPWTENVWIREVQLQDLSASGGYMCEHFSSARQEATGCIADPEYKNVNLNWGAPSLTKTGRQRYTCCNALRALACVK